MPYFDKFVQTDVTSTGGLGGGGSAQDLWETFKDDMSDCDFDFYMRKAIARYEGHQEGYNPSF